MAGLLSLVIDTVDEFNRVQELQQLLKISTNLEPKEIRFLVEAYLQLSEGHVEQCFLNLDRIQKTLNDNLIFED